MERPDLFPSDEVILERSHIWSTLMKSWCNEENYEDFEYSAIEDDSDEISDDNAATKTTNKNENQCKDLVKVGNYEANSSSDDYEDFANESIALIEERKRKWEASGMLNILETFDLDLIKKEVTPWIEKNRLLNNSRDGHNSTSVDEHIVHIEEHHHQVHVASDNDSMHANYGRSSRRKTSCTTTTIKKICVVKGSKKNKVVNEKKNSVNLPEILHRRFNELNEENKRNTNVTPPLQTKAKAFEPQSCQMPRRPRPRRFKRRSEIPKRSVSSSSSSSSDSPPRHLISKFRKNSKKNIPKMPPNEVLPRIKPFTKNFDETLKKEPSPTILISSEESDFLTRDIVDMTLKNTTKTKSQLDPKIPSCNETGFLGTSVINSTALSTINQPRFPNFPNICLLSPITQKSAQPTSHNQNPEDRLKVLLYCPDDIDLHKENIVNNRFKLTKEYFIQTVGKTHSCRFVRLNGKKFPYEFDSKSQIYFKKYESDHNVSSDEDILYVFGREGKLIVETAPQDNVK